MDFPFTIEDRLFNKAGSLLSFVKKMTIKGLWDYLTNKQHHCLKKTPCEFFEGYAISIDLLGECTSIRMSARKHLAQKWDVVSRPLDEDAVDRIMLRKLVEFILTFLDWGITPIFVYEGHGPPSKAEVKKEREERRNLHLQKMKDLRSTIRSQGVFSSSKEIEKLKLLEGQYPSFPKKYRENVYTFISELGIPCIKCAEGVEAETVASILCIRGVTAAVYSADGDCQAMGAHVQIRSKATSYKDGLPLQSYQVVFHEEVLESLNITHDEFLDVCIVAKCDHNNGIKGVSFVTALKLSNKYGSYENFPSTYDTSEINYDMCRDIFSEKSPEKYLDRDSFEMCEEPDSWEDIQGKLFCNFGRQSEELLAENELENFSKYFVGRDTKKPKFYEHFTDGVYNYPEDVEEMEIKKKFVRKTFEKKVAVEKKVEKKEEKKEERKICIIRPAPKRK